MHPSLRTAGAVRALTIAATVAAVGLTACGGSDDGAGANANAGAEATTSAPDPPTPDSSVRNAAAARFVEAVNAGEHRSRDGDAHRRCSRHRHGPPVRRSGRHPSVGGLRGDRRQWEDHRSTRTRDGRRRGAHRRLPIVRLQRHRSAPHLHDAAIESPTSHAARAGSWPSVERWRCGMHQPSKAKADVSTDVKRIGWRIYPAHGRDR